MSKKQRDAFKAKEKKQKIAAAVGGVLLVILLVIQVPKVMKQLNRGKAEAAAPVAVKAPAVGTPTPSLAAPTLRGEGQGIASSAGGAGLVSSSEPGVTAGQLASFSRFVSKDPFSQQIVTGSGSSASGSGGSTGSTGSSESPSGGSSSGSAPAPGDAVIAVNGTLMSVTVGTDFPQPSTADPSAVPFFHLVSLTATTAKISIAGGSYANGAVTVTLRVNKPITLKNTADGSRYTLVLKPQGTIVPGEDSDTDTSTVTLPAPTP